MRRFAHRSPRLRLIRAASLAAILAWSTDAAATPTPAALTAVIGAAPTSTGRGNTAQARALTAQAVAHIKAKDWAAAAPLLEQAVAADPAHLPARWELGWVYVKLARWEDAAASWAAIEALDPTYPELTANLRQARERVALRAWLASLPPFTPPLVDETPAAGPSLSVTAVGDVQLGRAWPPERAALPPGGTASLFAQVAAPLAAGQVTFGNLETALADDGQSAKCGPTSKNCFSFRAPTASAAALAAAGFDVLSTANNHAGDFGAAGLYATMAALDAAGIRHSGRTGRIARWTVDGLSLALAAFAIPDSAFTIQDLAGAQRLVAELDRTADVVLVSFHGGAEGAGAEHVPGRIEIGFGEDRGDVRAFGRAVVDAGADLVLGHGPHVLRAMELYRGRLIAYSLGNFCSYKTFSIAGPAGMSAILQARLAPNGALLEARVLPLRFDMERDGAPEPDPEGRAIARIRELSRQDLGAAALPLDEAGRWSWQGTPGPARMPRAQRPDRDAGTSAPAPSSAEPAASPARPPADGHATGARPGSSTLPREPHPPSARAPQPAAALTPQAAALEIDSLYERIDALRDTASLVIRHLSLVHEPAVALGAYQALAGPLRGEELFIYAEVGNHALRRLPDGRFELALASSVAILEPDGRLIISDDDLGSARLVAAACHRETFVNVAVRAHGIPDGQYRLRLTVRDTLGGKSASAELPFTVRHPR